jgi:hypothetical protein
MKISKKTATTSCSVAAPHGGRPRRSFSKLVVFLARGPVLCRDHVRINANFPPGSLAPSGFFDQGIFDEADHRRDDSPSDAATRQLPGQHTNIEAARAARRPAQGRYKSRQD